MKNNTIKLIVLVVVMASPLVIGSAYAAHELMSKSTAPIESIDDHISWHEFKHDLVSFSRVNAMIDQHGVITLSGNVSSGFEMIAIESLASKVRGATDV